MLLWLLCTISLWFEDRSSVLGHCKFCYFGVLQSGVVSLWLSCILVIGSSK
uniref:Uncharacterized protein n=1 Tax=Rhizophora mucronata TaxID=61149 RepID=A0A2P2NSZ0_RHIMU